MKNKKTVELPERELQCSFVSGKDGRITLPKKSWRKCVHCNAPICQWAHYKAETLIPTRSH